MQTSGTALPPVRARTVSATPDTFGFRESSAFQPELEYLEGERRLGRLATVDGTGQPHVVPVGWSYNPELGTIDTVGHKLAASKKFRNVRTNPKVAFVVDDLASVNAWRPRSVMVQGNAEAMEASDDQPPLIRIPPEKVFSWGLDRQAVA